MTQAEYAALDQSTQNAIDTDTADMVKRYGADWVRKEKVRLRNELAFVYGV